MIYEGSRYQNSIILRPQSADGEHRPTVYPAPVGPIAGTRYRSHITRDGERFDTIAEQLWGDPELWWRIADLNPEFLYPSDIPPGSVIRIPLA